MPEGITIDATDEQLAGLKYNSDGLITAIAQDVENGDIFILERLARCVEVLVDMLHLEE